MPGTLLGACLSSLICELVFQSSPTCLSPPPVPAPFLPLGSPGPPQPGHPRAPVHPAAAATSARFSSHLSLGFSSCPLQPTLASLLSSFIIYLAPTGAMCSARLSPHRHASRRAQSGGGEMAAQGGMCHMCTNTGTVLGGMWHVYRHHDSSGGSMHPKPGCQGNFSAQR